MSNFTNTNLTDGFLKYLEPSIPNLKLYIKDIWMCLL